MGFVDNLPEPFHAILNERGRHASWRWKVEAIAANPNNWGTWKTLAVWPKGEREKATTARRSLTDRYGKTPSVSGWDFATVTGVNEETGEEETVLSAYYDPEMKRKEREE